MCIVTVDCSISGWLVHEIGNALAILHAGTARIYFFEFFIASLSVVVSKSMLFRNANKNKLFKNDFDSVLVFQGVL